MTKPKQKRVCIINGIKRNNPGPYKRPKKRKRGRPKLKKKPGRPKKKRPVGRPPGSTKNDIEITTQEQLFCNLILENKMKPKKSRMTQTECYRIAYQNYKMKDSSAQVTASMILKRPKLKKYMQARKKKAAAKVELTVSKVLKGLLRIVEFDIRKLFDSKGRPIPIHKLPTDIALGISSVDLNAVSRRLPSGRRKITYYPKHIKNEARKPAWELLGNHLNMFNGEQGTTSPEEFVNGVRDFADSILDGIPGGQI